MWRKTEKDASGKESQPKKEGNYRITLGSSVGMNFSNEQKANQKQGKK